MGRRAGQREGMWAGQLQRSRRARRRLAAGRRCAAHPQSTNTIPVARPARRMQPPASPLTPTHSGGCCHHKWHHIARTVRQQQCATLQQGMARDRNGMNSAQSGPACTWAPIQWPGIQASCAASHCSCLMTAGAHTVRDLLPSTPLAPGSRQHNNPSHGVMSAPHATHTPAQPHSQQPALRPTSSGLCCWLTYANSVASTGVAQGEAASAKVAPAR